MHNNFYIYHDKFQDYSDKSIDWHIKSWSLKGIDKEIALLYREKNYKEAIRCLKKAVKYLND